MTWKVNLLKTCCCAERCICCISLSRLVVFGLLNTLKIHTFGKIPEVVALLSRDSTHVAYLDQCAYGLKVPNTEGKLGFCKKQTVFAGNFHRIVNLGRKCPGNHNHVHAVGGVKTKTGWHQRSELAGHYPAQLCKAYAIVVSHLVP